MKLVFFNDFKLGVLKDDRVVDLTNVVQHINQPTPQDLLNGVISEFRTRYRNQFLEAAEKGQGVPLSQVKLQSPLPRPGKIVAMAANYLENGALKEARPINAFLKSPETILATGGTVVLPPDQANVFHHEAELGIVIGKEGAYVGQSEAYNYIFGYVNFIDVSARGLGGSSFFWGKSWDTFGPCGPYLVTADEIADPQNVPIQLWVNGDLRQNYNTNDMGHSIRRTIEWITSVTTLEPGDLIACGTNHQGLGAIQNGDQIEMEIPGLGRLKVQVKDDLKREWPRGIDHVIGDRVAGRA